MGIMTKVMYAKHLALCWLQTETPIALCPSVLFFLFELDHSPFPFSLCLWRTWNAKRPNYQNWHIKQPWHVDYKKELRNSWLQLLTSILWQWTYYWNILTVGFIELTCADILIFSSTDLLFLVTSEQNVVRSKRPIQKGLMGVEVQPLRK